MIYYNISHSNLCITAAPSRFSSAMTAWSIRSLLGGPSVTSRNSLRDCSGFLRNVFIKYYFSHN